MTSGGWVVVRQRLKFNAATYWTGRFVGPQTDCNPVVTLDPDKAARWPDAQAARAAVEAYDNRMWGQVFEVRRLVEEWGE